MTSSLAARAWTGVRALFVGKSAFGAHSKLFGRRSYAQCGEDVIIDFLLMWLGLKSVVYLDIGANHATWLSNTYYFYRKGYSGVLIEPDPDLHRQLRSKRPRDRALNIAVGVDGRSSAKLHRMTSNTLNTLASSHAEEYASHGRERIEQVIEVVQMGINELLKQEIQRTPNLVSLDVEGLDLQILQQWDFSEFRPEVFCIETLSYSQNKSERKVEEILELMKAKDYRIYADTYINTIFVAEEAWANRKN